MSFSSYQKITHPRAKKNIANMREKYQTFGCQNHMEQNVLTKRNRLGSKPKLFRNRAVQLPRPDASRPNQTSANKGRPVGDEGPTSRRISSHILRNDFVRARAPFLTESGPPGAGRLGVAMATCRPMMKKFVSRGFLGFVLFCLPK